ncbi:hypothetical protein BLS_007454 [Venturia inaequalis]|nr:hypothetical protein BLS_007454 [Venturia inaequalis]KAE9985076.1 hypothetical protein EG328_007847 [Venturia inaequalis]
MGPKVSSPPSSTLNANPGITPAPTTNPGITDPGTPIYPVPVEPLPFPQTLNLPPVALRSVVVDPAQGFDNQNSTKLPKCSCEPLNCEGSEGSGDQAICAALAAEKCAKTCPSALKATQAAMDPFHHLMSEGGRPPPNQAQAPSQEYSQEQQSLIDQLSAPDHAP